MSSSVNLPEISLVQGSTQVNRDNALEVWNSSFAPKANCPIVQDLTVAYMVSPSNDRPTIVRLFSQYCHHLVMMKKKDGSSFVFGTLKQRLSGVHTFLHEKFPSLNLLNKETAEGAWYGQLWKSFRSQHFVLLWKRGEQVRSQSGAMRKEELTEMVLTLCENGSDKAVHTIVMGLILYNLCGRAGELGLLSFKNTKWLDDAMFFILPNPKNTKEQELDIYPHFDSPILCPFYWLSTYLIVCSSSFATDNNCGWLFPKLRSYYGDGNVLSTKKKQAVSQAVTSLLDSLLKNGAKSHWFRHGAADDLILLQALRDNCAVLFGAIFRGGWDFASECEFFNYLFQRTFITQSGKALGGYPNARMRVAMPSLAAIIECDLSDDLCKLFILLFTLTNHFMTQIQPPMHRHVFFILLGTASHVSFFSRRTNAPSWTRYLPPSFDTMSSM